MSGEVEALWQQAFWQPKLANYMRVAGKNFRVELKVYRDLYVGQVVNVEFLPRSHVAVKVEPQSSP